MGPRCYDQENKQMDFDMSYGKTDGPMCEPIFECPETRVCDRYIMHEIQHIMPVHTRIVNHHIYRHIYTPCYTCDMCDTVENVYDQCCKNF